MSTLTGDDLPLIMSQHLVDHGADTTNAPHCKYALLRTPDLLEREIDENLSEAMAIAEMARYCERESKRLEADLAKELKR